MTAPDQPPPARRPPLPARLLGIGARAGERVASATGIDDAVEGATEEAIVRALESPAVERAIVRVLESDAAQDAFERTLSSPAVERAAVKVLDSELVDHVWDRLLASDEAQKLVERIAEAPEVRAAIASQGVGLIEDIGRQVRRIADRLDDGLERLRAPAAAAPRARRRTAGVGLVTRGRSRSPLDGVILNGIFLARRRDRSSALFGGDGVSGAGLASSAPRVLDPLRRPLPAHVLVARRPDARDALPLDPDRARRLATARARGSPGGGSSARARCDPVRARLPRRRHPRRPPRLPRPPRGHRRRPGRPDGRALLASCAPTE